jgi:hypothetical protein
MEEVVTRNFESLKVKVRVRWKMRTVKVGLKMILEEARE